MQSPSGAGGNGGMGLGGSHGGASGVGGTTTSAGGGGVLVGAAGSVANAGGSTATAGAGAGGRGGDSGAFGGGTAAGGSAGSSGAAAGASGGGTAVTGLLAYDDMGSTAGDVTSFGGPDQHNNYGLAPGFGWCPGCGWSLYGETPQPGQASVESDNLLTYPGLKTNGFRMAHMRDVQGRMLDVPGAFADYANADMLIGKDGTSLWLSVLIRVEAALGSDPVVITTHSDASAWHNNEAIWSAGLYSSADWSFFSCTSGACGGDPRSPGIERASSGKSFTVGKTTLLVLRFDFKSGPDDIALFVDPVVGAAAPAPDVAITAPGDLSFRDFAFNASGVGVSFDEVRFGRTFASVTPSQ